MKKIMLIILLLCINNLSAQEIPKVDGKYCISNVIELPGKTANEIKNGTKDFLVRHNSDSNFIIDSPNEIFRQRKFPSGFYNWGNSHNVHHFI